ncbi:MULTISPECIES: NAD(P)/FAD-dependent oxidoreductase [unclassified Maribacter]|uniref:NAD(P)/FAD-dependent oxidoreductase n=1 Tax=unclassified Maribacter TaxID=2615042 RepID=UPI00257DE219|nr:MULTISPECIES: NAD(P)/FAD-dependent oxidoreductase [unclassified Maribacter]|tara:strand:+ start:63990 stop:65258 length:1269 start_codon:yes stop_codon:yes gene_type:complete
MAQKPKIVIIGAGFGGIAMAKSFKNKPVEVLIIDQHNYHNFQPLMYQVATGGLEPASIAYPVRRIFRNYRNISFRMAEVFSVSSEENTIATTAGAISYDYLIIATGSQNNFFNFEPVKDKLLTLKSIPDALNLRSFIFQNLEKAMEDNQKELLDEILNIAIVGGGPAGIELAGALAEMKRYVIPKDFPGLDVSKMSINLYEASSKLLSVMSSNASEKSEIYLKELGINVFLNAKVNDYDGSTITLDDNTTFKTDTVIWTAGVKGAPINGLSKDVIVGGNRISINEYNQVLGYDTIFAIGDVAAHVIEENPKGLPMLAPVAQQQGKLLSKNIIRYTSGKPMEVFTYKDKGTMATVGRKKAVVDLPKWKFQGTFAWFVWMFIHIFSLVGFRNKLVAFVDWFSNYISYDRPLGLIIRPYKIKENK